MKSTFFLVILSVLTLQTLAQSNPFTDGSRNYSLPTFTKNEKGQAVIYWSEKDDQNKSYLYFATSTDDGKTFSDKQLIFADAGLGGGRLMRPKLLFKKSGEMVAVFAHRGAAAAPARPQQPEQANHAGHGDAKPATPTPPAGGRGGGRSGQVKFVSSKDGGKTWTEAMPVDTDPTPLLRGFFDAVVLANDEIAVAYLKDVKGSTKHEERDLRMAITKNGVFQDEKLIDPVVCDCCNIGLLVDAKGVLNLYYRDNNNDIRDIAVMKSSDNGATFSKSQILYNDKWEIMGCPHSGASSVATGNGALITWFSGGQNTPSGVRLVNSEGKLLKVLPANAKNAALAADAKNSVFVWEENSNGINNIFYSTVTKDQLSTPQKLAGSEKGQNASSIIINGKTLVAYETPTEGKKMGLVVKAL